VIPKALTGCLLLGGLLLSTSSAAAQNPPRYALGEVAVTGANPIGTGNGILFRRQFDSECGLQPPASPFSPLSVPLGADALLQLTVISCPAGSPPVAVECRAQVGDDKSSVSFAGEKADLPVPLPGRTGIYDLRLSCTVGTPPAERFETELYMTWREALPWSTIPPRAKWYERACTWGAGFDARATEAQVLEKMLEGLYAYGPRHWRYGYASSSAGAFCDGPCLFCKADAPCRCRCPCPWPNLLADNPACDFGDCFTFAAILQNLAGLMGVPVGPTLQIPEKKDQPGFMTRPSFDSLDPAFPGNVDCGGRGLPCTYLFPVHALIELHGVFYDPTFGRSFDRLSDLIAQRVIWLSGKNEVLETSVACFTGMGYGGWQFYVERPRLEDCVLDLTSPVKFTSAPVEVEAVTLEGEEQPVVLGVTLEVEARSAGSYFIGASLESEGRLVTQRPLASIQVRSIETFHAGAPGRQTVSLLFSGEEVRRHGRAPLTLHAWLASEKGLVESREIPLSQLPPEQFDMLGERPASFAGEPVVVQGEGGVFLLEVPVFVRVTGEVLLQAALSSSGMTLGISGWAGRLSRGEHVLRIELKPRRIVANSGELKIKLALQWGEPPTPVDWQVVPVRP
jgi:hypothetical protein